MSLARVLVAFVALLSAFAASGLRAAPLEVVASFSILGDLVRQVGRERVIVTTLVGPDMDAHNYQPRPSDARRLGTAPLVVMNGLGFDNWVERLAQSAGYKGRLLVASAGIEAPANIAEPSPGPGAAAVDPHAWQDPRNVLGYVANIANALADADPAGASLYRDNAAHYTAELKALDAAMRDAFARVPPERRKVVSSHDAFGYLGRAYGIHFVAAVGIGNQSEPSASGIAQLIRQLRREKVPAVFVESISDPRLAERIRKESGARLGGTLYSDALSGPDGPAPTYLDMMRHNLGTLIDGLSAEPG
jgi:zinc/manganese transport system substrate-binding protein